MVRRALFVFVFAAGGVSAQDPAQDLAHVLDVLRGHVEKLETSVPNFICREQIVSQLFLGTKAKKTTRAEAVLATTRIHTSRRTTFTEARSEMKINGKASYRNEIPGPFTWHGGPAYGDLHFLFNSERGEVCMSRELKGRVKLDGREAFLLVTHAAATVASDAGCLNVRPDSSDNVWLDPETLNVIRIESFDPPTKPIPDSELTLIVDYAPVTFDGVEYWLPSRFLSKLDFPGTPKHLQYEATFTGYHKFGAESVIHIDPVQ